MIPSKEVMRFSLPECRFVQALAIFSFCFIENGKASLAVDFIRAAKQSLWVDTLHCIQAEITKQQGNQIQVRYTFAEIKEASGYLTARTGDAALKDMLQEALKQEWESSSAGNDQPRLNGLIVYQIERNPLPCRLFDEYQKWLRGLGKSMRVPGHHLQRRRKLRRIIRIH